MKTGYNTFLLVKLHVIHVETFVYSVDDARQIRCLMQRLSRR